MNSGQILRAVKKHLEARAWDVGAGETVFGGVVITGRTTQAAVELGFPLVELRVLGETPDPEHPQVVTAELEVALSVWNESDQLGEFAFAGGALPNGIGSSDGKGLLQVEGQLKAAIAKLGRSQGVRVVAFTGDGSEGTIVEQSGYVAQRTYRLRAIATAEETFPAADWFKAAAAGSGNVTLTWRALTTRFDFYRVTINRKAGSSAPTSATDATATTVYSGALSTFSDSPGAGTFSYAIWVQYDDTVDTPASAVRTSSSKTQTVVAT